MRSLLLIFATVILVVSGTNPGLRIQANQNALNYMKSIGVNILNSKIGGVKIPDYSGSSGQFSYSLTNIRITKFSAPDAQASVTLHDPNQISMRVGVSVGVDADYHVKLGHGWLSISKSGSVTADASGTPTVTTGLLTRSGKPQVDLKSCNANVDVNDLHFHGDLIDQIANLFEHYIKDYVSGKLRSVVCDELSKVVRDDANAYLIKMPTSTSIKDGFGIDYSLVGNPVVQYNNVASIGMLGKVWYQGHENDPNIPKAMPTPLVTGSGKMFSINMDLEEVLGSAGYALLVSGKAHMVVDQSILNQLKLGPIMSCDCATTCIGKLIPQIKSKCPTGGVVNMAISLTKTPVAHVNTSGAFVSLSGQAEFVSVSSTGQQTPLFTVEVTASAVLPSPVTFKDWTIKMQVHITGASLTVKSSQVGQVDQKGLQQIWQMVLMLVVEQELNKLGAQGIALPEIPDMNVLQPELDFGDHTLTMCFNAQYTGPLKFYKSIKM